MFWLFWWVDGMNGEVVVGVVCLAWWVVFVFFIFDDVVKVARLVCLDLIFDELVYYI